MSYARPLRRYKLRRFKELTFNTNGRATLYLQIKQLLSQRCVFAVKRRPQFRCDLCYSQQRATLLHQMLNDFREQLHENSFNWIKIIAISIFDEQTWLELQLNTLQSAYLYAANESSCIGTIFDAQFWITWKNAKIVLQNPLLKSHFCEKKMSIVSLKYVAVSPEMRIWYTNDSFANFSYFLCFHHFAAYWAKKMCCTVKCITL